MAPRRLGALIVAAIALWCGAPASPAQTQPEAGAATGSVPAVVEGLASGDLLNIRALASPTAPVIARLPNGAMVQKFGCSTVNGYEWCKVAGLDGTELPGWTPARYLRANAGEATSNPPRQSAADAMPASSAPDPEIEPEVDGPEAAAAPADANETPGVEVDKLFGLVAQEFPKTRVDDVFLAFRAEDGASGAIFTPEAAKPPSAEMTGALPATAPVPAAPRMPRIDAARQETLVAPPAGGGPDVLAQVQSEPGTEVADAAREIPCARYTGQPMTRCQTRVERLAEASADVIVIWPDGGSRVLSFRAGKPEGSNSRGEFRFTREADLNMIRVGAAERFEVPDSVAFGD